MTAGVELPRSRRCLGQVEKINLLALKVDVPKSHGQSWGGATAVGVKP